MLKTVIFLVKNYTVWTDAFYISQKKKTDAFYGISIEAHFLKEFVFWTLYIFVL